MIYDFDIIVIGASPSGYIAALNSKMKHNELNIAIFEKKKSLKENIHPSNSIYNIMYSILNEYPNKNYIIYKINGMKIISPSKKFIQFNDNGWVIDKFKFDEFYFKKNLELGVNIFFNFNVTNIKINKDHVLVTVITNEKKVEYTTKLVIISNGINSNLVSLLNINTIKYRNDIAWGIEANITYPNIGVEKYAEYYIGSHAPGWKSSYLPMGGDMASIGIYVRRHGKNINDFFNRWLEQFYKIKKIEQNKIKVNYIRYGGDPIVTIPKNIFSNRVLITGGAAGQSGIAYGMFSGKIAGEVASDSIIQNNITKKYLSNYNYLWKKKLYYEYVLGRLSLEIIRKSNDNQINYIFDLLDGITINKLLKENLSSTCISIIKYLFKKDKFFVLNFLLKKIY